MNTIGIDPGLRGAIAFVTATSYEVHDLPVIKDGALSWIDGSELRRLLMHVAHDGMHCVIERVSAMPKQGVSSSFNFGVNYGSVLSIVQSAYLPLEFVTPGKWKRELGLSADKHASLHKARLLYPNAELHLVKHDGRAEALLIAHWARRRAGQVAA